MGIIALPLLRACAWVYSLFPSFVDRIPGNILGMLLRMLKIRSKIIRQNLEFAYPHQREKQDQLFREAYRHFGNVVFEVLLVLGPLRSYVLRRGKVLGLENWRQAKAQGKGVIFLASHVGNWEVMAATGAIQGGVDILLVTKHLKPEWLHRAIESGRARCGIQGTYEPRTLKDVLRHLGKNGTVGFVLDQYAGPPVGVRVPVFGVPVGTTAAVAALAKRTGALVLPVVNYRTPDGGWIVDMRPPLKWISDPDPNRELALNTAAYAADLEKDIYAHPEQWLWTHRRFKGDLSPIRENEWSEGRARK